MPSTPTLTLLAYVFVLLPGMLTGFYFARRRRFSPHHRGVMTAVTVINWVLILWLMVTSYASAVLPNLPERLLQPTFLLPTLHLITGAVAQLLATYLVILMWTEQTRFERMLPIRVRNIKRMMRLTLGLWVTTIGLGIAIYAVWYAAPPASPILPVSTEEAAMLTTEEAGVLSTQVP